MKILIIALLVSVTVSAHSQDCDARLFYENELPACSDYIDGVQCIDLDITDSYDFEGKELIFIWDLGDGQEKEGLQVSHCYEEGGAYEAALTLIDPITKIEIERELVVDVFIKGPSQVKIDSIEPLSVNEIFVPKIALNLPDNYSAQKFYWSLGDGRYACDENPELSYGQDGTYQLLLNIEVVNGPDTFHLCHQRDILVGSEDPSGGLLDSLFAELPIETRFLNSPITHDLLAKTPDGVTRVSADQISPENKYVLTSYRGNQFYVSEEISGSTEAEIKDQIAAIAVEMANTKPLVLESIIFDLNESDMSKKHKKELDKSIEKLNDAKFFKIMVGSFTHTGGAFDRNRKLSVQRSELIIDYLVNEGIDKSRIIIADPSNQRSLINTCLTGSACDYEDPSLNRRSDFKIVGITEIEE